MCIFVQTLSPLALPHHHVRSPSLTDTYYSCNVSLNCQGSNGVWYHGNRSISNASLQSVRFDDAGHYQCKTPSDAVLDEFTLHVYGELSGVLCGPSVGTL